MGLGPSGHSRRRRRGEREGRGDLHSGEEACEQGWNGPPAMDDWTWRTSLRAYRVTPRNVARSCTYTPLCPQWKKIRSHHLRGTGRALVRTHPTLASSASAVV